jgi:prepilin-type processing-associated H-X9-DG protein
MNRTQKRGKSHEREKRAIERGRTSNTEHRTSNIQREAIAKSFVRRWMFDVGCRMFLLSQTPQPPRQRGSNIFVYRPHSRKKSEPHVGCYFSNRLSANSARIYLNRTARRHSGVANVAFCDSHVEGIKFQPLFFDESDEALKRWNNDHEPHREVLR